MIREFFADLKQAQEAQTVTETREYPAIELEHLANKSHGNGSSTTLHYKVEVRTSYPQPKVLNTGGREPFVIDFCWRELPIRLGGTPFGTNIPIQTWDRDAAEQGMVSYIAAEAHRWGFLAWLDANEIGGTMCIETRLVKVEMQKTYKLTELGVGPVQQYPRETGFTERAPSSKQAAA